MRIAVWLVAVLAAPWSTLQGQVRAPGVIPASAPASDTLPWLVADPPHGLTQGPATPPRSSASLWSVPASAVLPGSGQVMLGLARFAPYMVIEALGWLQYRSHRSDFRRHRDGYRHIAATVARAPFTTNPPVGDFPYYEHMRYWLESGAFDRIPGGAIEPELDSTTYNGAMWLLARRTFWPNADQPPDTGSVEYRQAIAFYERRAYDAQYLWSWRGVEEQRDRFGQTIRRANDSHRKSVQDLGLLVANHLLSTIDAYVTVRLRRGAPGSGDASRWTVTGTIPLPQRP